ncbi:MAG TPA: hypothetical protein VFV36_07515, partial [Candidatus Methylomirabilis sp.]|nr:hypothetical protein [Candidatus Methylomirabilis sp.]
MTLVILSLLQALAHGAAGTVSETPRPTIEPTLPLVVDMRLSGLDRHEGRARGRLHIDLTADGDLDQVEPTLALPGALRVVDGTALPLVFGLANGERRRFVLAVEGPDDLDLPIRLEVAFRNADGRTFRLG